MHLENVFPLQHFFKLPHVWRSISHLFWSLQFLKYFITCCIPVSKVWFDTSIIIRLWRLSSVQRKVCLWTPIISSWDEQWILSGSSQLLRNLDASLFQKFNDPVLVSCRSDYTCGICMNFREYFRMSLTLSAVGSPWTELVNEEKKQ